MRTASDVAQYRLVRHTELCIFHPFPLRPLDLPFGWKVYLQEKTGEHTRRKTVVLAWNERPLTLACSTLMLENT